MNIPTTVGPEASRNSHRRLGSGDHPARWLLAAALLGMLADGVHACGGAYIPDCMIGNDEQMVRSPETDFELLLRQALADQKAEFTARPPDYGQSNRVQTGEADLIDLMASLESTRLTELERKAAAKSYEVYQKALWEYQFAVHRWVDGKQWAAPGAVRPPKPQFDPPQVDRNVPLEFIAYKRGAAAWQGLDHKRAREHWQKLLALPEAQRQYRSVWAAYMIGRSLVVDDPKQAIQWFEKTRQLAKQGFKDSTGLAAASFGWQGRAELNQRRPIEAMRLYVRQTVCGDGSGMASLRMCISQIMHNETERLSDLAKDDLLRRVVTAHMVAGSSPLWAASGTTRKEHVAAWLKALEDAGVDDVAGAGRLAWAAYRTGLMVDAQRWVARATENDAIAHWIDAKLSLRAGQLPEAAEALARAMPLMKPVEGESRLAAYCRDRAARTMAAELASLRLNRRQYVEALELVFRYEHEDAVAYLAERILTHDELRAFIEEHKDHKRATALKDLFARRLVRAGNWKKARPYFSHEKQKKLDAYIKAIRAGHEPFRSQAERADEFWRAAEIAEADGNALMGYDTGWYGSAPDGLFHPWRDFARSRRPEWFTVVPVEEDEKRRADTHAPKPLETWHHLYEATGHAWRACELMPDEDEKTAHRLWQAGTWIKYHDPKAADRFYKALVNRCGSTELGREAAKKRWFPKPSE